MNAQQTICTVYSVHCTSVYVYCVGDTWSSNFPVYQWANTWNGQLSSTDKKHAKLNTKKMQKFRSLEPEMNVQNDFI